MSIVARSKYLKGVAAALEHEVAGSRAILNTLTELMQAARKDLDIAQAAADQAEKRFEQARQRVLDAYSHIGFLHTKLGVINEQLQEVAPASSASGVQYKPCEICTTQSWCETHGCQCYPTEAMCCVDYPRCDCNSPPEPDNASGEGEK